MKEEEVNLLKKLGIEVKCEYFDDGYYNGDIYNFSNATKNLKSEYYGTLSVGEQFNYGMRNTLKEVGLTNEDIDKIKETNGSIAKLIKSSDDYYSKQNSKEVIESTTKNFHFNKSEDMEEYNSQIREIMESLKTLSIQSKMVLEKSENAFKRAEKIMNEVNSRHGYSKKNTIQNTKEFEEFELEVYEGLSFSQEGYSEGKVINDAELNLKETNKIYNLLKNNNALQARNDIDQVIIHPSTKGEGGYQASFHINGSFAEALHYENKLDVAKMMSKREYKVDNEYNIENNIQTKGGLKTLNIQNEKVLERIDKIMDNITDVKLRFSPVKGEFDFKHLNDINKFKYGSMYELPRIPSEKIKECKEVLKDIKNEKISKTNNIDQFINKTTKHIKKIYNINVFEKGNVNTLKEFTRNLGMAAGYNIDLSKVKNEVFEFALNKANEGSFDKLNNLIKDNALNKEPLKDMIKTFERCMEIGR